MCWCAELVSIMLHRIAKTCYTTTAHGFKVKCKKEITIIVLPYGLHFKFVIF